MRLKARRLAVTCLLAALGTAAILATDIGELNAVSDTRTLSLYMVHTKESLTVTYKKNGRYIPSALRQLNHFMRDWRKNEVIKMDPEVIDLVWELQQEVGSKKPVHVICGYRNDATNKMLKKIGRNVATKSMHSRGQAIDIYFPDVSAKKVRNAALVRQVGGVGYYPRSGPSGFVHVDTGRVRHWPGIPKQELAAIMKNAPAKSKTRSAPVMMAEDGEDGGSSLVSLISRVTGSSKKGEEAPASAPATAEAATPATNAPEKSKPEPRAATLIAAADVPQPRVKPKRAIDEAKPQQTVVAESEAAESPAPILPAAKPTLEITPRTSTPTITASVAPPSSSIAGTELARVANPADISVEPASAPAPEKQSFARAFTGDQGAKTSLGGSHPMAGAMSRPLAVAPVQASARSEAFWKEQNLKFSLKPHFFKSNSPDPLDLDTSSSTATLSLEAPASDQESFSFLPPVLSELTRLFLPFDTASVDVSDDGEAQPGGPAINREDKGNLLMSRHHQTTINGAAKGPRMDAYAQDLVAGTPATSGPVNLARAGTQEPEPLSFQE